MAKYSMSSLAHHTRGQLELYLLAQLVRRDLAARFRGSLGGVAWLVAGPLLMLGVYWLVLEQVFQPRWAGSEAAGAPFTMQLFAGLAVFSVFGEAVARAPSLIAANESFVRKVVFPLELLPVSAVATALATCCAQLLVLALAHLVLVGMLPLQALLLPVALFPVVLFTLGVCWLVAALGVYVRDLAHAISPIVTMVLFLSPVLYPSMALPAEWRGLVTGAPIGAGIDMARALMLGAAVPTALSFLSALALAVIVAVAGLTFFRLTSKGFADVL